jgi:LysR family transcriptional regulator of gallate degradation
MLAAVSAQQLHYEREAGQLALLDIAMHNTRRDIGLTLRAGGSPSPAARVTIDALRLTVDELGHVMRRDARSA